MNNYADRYRYGRYNYQVRRRKRNPAVKKNWIEKIIRQLAVALLIFAILWGIKAIDSGITNYISSKVKWIVTESMSIDSIYAGIDRMVDRITGKKPDGGGKGPADGIDGEIDEGGLIPAGAGFSDSLKNTEGFADKSDGDEDMVSGVESSVSVDFSLQRPVEGAVVVRFGKTVNEATGESFFHTGIDIEAENGAVVLAADAGIVAEAGSNPLYSKYIKINHKNGVSTIYAHCGSFKVDAGQTVEKGDPIAVIGGADGPAGTHLHFEVWIDGEPVDPEKFFM